VENKALGFSLGVTDYIVKPFDRQNLLDRLKKLNKTTNHKILVVDDDPDVSAMFEEALKSEGFAVDLAQSRETVFQKLTDKPDVLFLDLMMPNLSGFEVLQKIEKDPSLKDLRVFVMTAKHLTPDEMRYLENRAEVIVQKGSRDVGEVLSLLKQKLHDVTGAAQ
jgi:DNA-binding response OmpR family regulator